MNHRKKVVLLVGLLCSGKSTVLRELHSHGAAIICMDSLWKQEIYQECHRQRLINVLGENVLHDDGTPKLERLRELFFSLDRNQRHLCVERQQRLYEAFTDIFIAALRREIRLCATNPETTLVVVESAIALSGNWREKISPDETVVLHCNQQVRFDRFIKRNPRIGAATCLAIMDMQLTDDELSDRSFQVEAIQYRTECSIEGMREIALSLHEYLLESGK